MCYQDIYNRSGELICVFVWSVIIKFSKIPVPTRKREGAYPGRNEEGKMNNKRKGRSGAPRLAININDFVLDYV